VNGNFPGHVDIPRLDSGRVGVYSGASTVRCRLMAWTYSDENYARCKLSIYYYFFHRFGKTGIQVLTCSSRKTNLRTSGLDVPTPAHLSWSILRTTKWDNPLWRLSELGTSFHHCQLKDSIQLGIRSLCFEYSTPWRQVATLAHNCHNIFADAAVQETNNSGGRKATPLWGGISEREKTWYTK